MTSIDKIGDGVVQQGRGFTLIPIEYKAIVFRPFVGEVLDAVVQNVTKIGIFAAAGAFQIFISVYVSAAIAAIAIHHRFMTGGATKLPIRR